MSVRQTHTVYIQVYTNMDFHPENYEPVSKFEKKVAQAFVDSCDGDIYEWSITQSDFNSVRLITNTWYELKIQTNSNRAITVFNERVFRGFMPEITEGTVKLGGIEL